VPDPQFLPDLSEIRGISELMGRDDGLWFPARERTSMEQFFPCEKHWLDYRDKRWPSSWNHLTLNDLALRAVIRRHDRNNFGHCWISPRRMAAQAGLSMRDMQRSRAHLETLGLIKRGGRHQHQQIWMISTPRSDGGTYGWSENSPAKKVDDRRTLWLYEWIWTRRELSVTARFVFCLGAERARIGHHNWFRMSSRDAARILAVSHQTTLRAFVELERWRLIQSEKNRSTHFLREHPWHLYFRQQFQEIHDSRREEYWDGVATAGQVDNDDEPTS
jgi:DNA-binding transcriptional regulator YhcF (GntR family)